MSVEPFHLSCHKISLTYPTHLDEDAFRRFLFTLPGSHHASWWMAHKLPSKKHPEPHTCILIDFGRHHFESRDPKCFDFTGLSPQIQQLDDLAPRPYLKFLLRCSHDNTNNLSITQPWALRAACFLQRRGAPPHSLASVLNLFSPSGKADFKSFSMWMREAYSDRVVILESLENLHHATRELTQLNQSLLIFLTKRDVSEGWLGTSFILELLRDGSISEKPPHSILILSDEPIPAYGCLTSRGVDLVKVDSPELLEA